MRDINKRSLLEMENLSRVSGILPKPHHFVTAGNILFVVKGVNNYAVCIQEQLSKTIAAAHFFVIRIDRDDVLPEYVAWYINQPPAQAFLQERSKGTIGPSIDIGTLSELDVPLPFLEVQRKVIRIQELLRREQELTEHIQAKRDQLVKTVLLKTIQEGHNDGHHNS